MATVCEGCKESQASPGKPPSKGATQSLTKLLKGQTHAKTPALAVTEEPGEALFSFWTDTA